MSSQNWIHRIYPVDAPELGTGSAMIEIDLLGSFAVRHNGAEVLGLSSGTKRLLAFLALRAHGTRLAISGEMWPHVTERRAGDSLRSALARLEDEIRPAVTMDHAGLGLAPGVRVDLNLAKEAARRLLQPGEASIVDDLGITAITAFSSRILPDWYDGWVLAEVEDWRQLRLYALEEQAELLIGEGNLRAAAQAARAAMRVEPLRQSAVVSLVRVHLAEGNQSEALRDFEAYRTLLLTELHLEPTAILTDLVAPLRTH
ncbi:AfsR/SARP family transcriptional regulator [Agreia pratensis]|uniref:DNA-binding transcriptional activator of the SARP family n=1 Tax=Agreia pratensis TaxID=150121 RepID=A0A1X7KVY0_9MICO|nr:BTAD domain-containing putative transcriptional regulator [Agreia pratensis]SMG45674.1 DNA-binding transcriptional activator of the SARP family [Agreia pratensis]